MFKPSLRKSILSDKLCLPTQIKRSCFQPCREQKPRPVLKISSCLEFNQKINVPSMMISEQLLQKGQFSNNGNYTHVFTPLGYDFKQYPKAVKELIRPNPKAAQAGRIGDINFLIYQKNLILWTTLNNSRQSQISKSHKFHEQIDIVEFSILRNPRIFKKQQVIILAISFGNRMKLYKLNQKQLTIEDLMIKYQLKSCRKIQKIYFTDNNQIVFGGDSGQISMISFNKERQLIVNVKSAIIKRYLSKSAFDYFSRHLIKDIQVGRQFLYCLHDRICKSNYLMYCLKKTVNKVVRLSEEPRYIHEETFIDIYRFSNAQRRQIVFVDQLKQTQIEKKVKQGYVNCWDQGVKDAFRIVAVSITAQQQQQCHFTYHQQMKSETQQTNTKTQVAAKLQVFPTLNVLTKCGYLISLVHEKTYDEKFLQKTSLERDNFSFISEPTRLPQKVGQASLFESKVILSSRTEREYRRNFVVKSLSMNSRQSIVLFNNLILFSGNRELSMIRFDDLKKSICQSTKVQEHYVSSDDFQTRFQSRQQSVPQNVNGRKNLQNVGKQKPQTRYFRLFNTQRRWTVYDNQGRTHIYLLGLKHIILSYLYYQCQFQNQHRNLSPLQNLDASWLVESDLRFHSTIQKMIRIYGQGNFLKSLVQILMDNSNNQRQYFYLQKQLLVQVVKKQFQFQLPNKFQDWVYNLSQHNQAEKIVPTRKMLQFVWIMLFQHQHKSLLNSQLIHRKAVYSECFQKAQQLSELRSKTEYSAYGHALKSTFFDIIQSLIYFRARQFKQKQKQLRKCQQQLSLLQSYIQNKMAKSQTHEYKTYLSIKLGNLQRKKQLQPQHYPNNKQKIYMNSTYQNSLTNDQVFTVEGQRATWPETNRPNDSSLWQSNQKLQKTILSGIRKTRALIKAMYILIERDEREGLPNFVQIVTNYKKQIQLGQVFFEEQLLLSQNNVQFIHPQLVRQVEVTLPQLQLTRKIDYLKFKAARDILFGDSLNQVDLKSLNLDRLSSITASTDLPQLRKIFLGPSSDSSWQKTYFYTQFLSINLCKIIDKIRNLSTLQQHKFGSLSGSTEGKATSKGANSLTVYRIILARQQLEHNQQELSSFFQQVKSVFSRSTESLKSISGSQYYQAEKNLERLIQLLVNNFPKDQILLQTLEVILKASNLLQKVQFMNNLREKITHDRHKQQTRILSIPKQRDFKVNEKSTFQHLLEQGTEKNLSQQRTHDTWAGNSFRN